MKRFIRILVGVGVALAVLVVVGLVILYLSLGSAIKVGIEKLGPRIAGAPVSVADIDLALLRGRVEISGLVVGNPEGFQTDSAFGLESVRVAFEPRSIFSDCIVIREIAIAAPEITYEAALSGSNIAVIKKNVEAFAGKSDGTPPPDAAPKPAATGSGKRVIIDDFHVTGGKVRVSAKLLRGQALSVPLPEIRLRDIGRDSDGRSLKDVVTEVYTGVTRGIMDAIGSAGVGIGEGGKLLQESAADTGNAAKEGASKLFQGARNMFKRDAE